MITNIHDLLNAQGHFPRQRFVEYFSGKQISAIWTQGNAAGSGTFAMNDEIDGGYRVSSGTTASDRSQLTFNSKRPYSPTSSNFTIVGRDPQNTSGRNSYWGLVNGTNWAGTAVEGCIFDTTPATGSNYFATSGDASAWSQTSTGVAINTNYHIFTCVLGSSDLTYYVDSVLRVTKTTNRPTARLQPMLEGHTTGAATSQTDIRYLEVYNR